MRPIGRFGLHYLEMCAVMCLGAVVSVLFFGAAGLLGYTDMPQQFPELSVLVIAINLSLPMAAWMRFRGMDWRPTVEMAGSTMAVGLLLIAAYWLDIIPKSSLVEVQTSLACPLMLAVMLFRFPLTPTTRATVPTRFDTGRPATSTTQAHSRNWAGLGLALPGLQRATTPLWSALVVGGLWAM